LTRPSQYDLRPEPWEWAVFEPLSKDRHLPGRVETGLTTFQKHLSIALGRLLLQTGASRPSDYPFLIR